MRPLWSEHASAAHARGATCQARLLGCGGSSDAHHLTQPAPDGSGAARAIGRALTQAEVDPTQIGLASAHATATLDNDAGEAKGWAAALNGHRAPTVGLKSRMGHTLGAAGLLESALCAGVFADEPLPTTAKVLPEDLPEDAPNLLTGQPQTPAAPVQATAHAALGFGGANACTVLGAPQQAQAKDLPTLRPVVISGAGVLLPDADATTLTDDALFAHIHPRKTRRQSRLSKLALAGAKLALEDAGLEEADRAGMAGFLGTCHGAVAYCHDYYRDVVDSGLALANPMLFAEGVPNAAAAHLAMTHKLTGPCQAIIGTATSGLQALRMAALGVSLGIWPRALVVSAEEQHDLLRRAWGPLKSRPHREGAAALVIEPETTATRSLGKITATADASGSMRKALKNRCSPFTAAKAPC